MPKTITSNIAPNNERSHNEQTVGRRKTQDRVQLKEAPTSGASSYVHDLD
jgi:hypothetical protein